jgi:hypothetical protein
LSTALTHARIVSSAALAAPGLSRRDPALAALDDSASLADFPAI